MANGAEGFPVPFIGLLPTIGSEVLTIVRIRRHLKCRTTVSTSIWQAPVPTGARILSVGTGTGSW
jgi:hypothetical protein